MLDNELDIEISVMKSISGKKLAFPHGCVFFPGYEIPLPVL